MYTQSHKHIFLIHSFFNVPIGWFHILAIVHNAAVNMGVYLFKIAILFPLDISSEVGFWIIRHEVAMVRKGQ